MPLLSKNPLFPAVLLTVGICGSVAFLVGMPDVASGDSGPASLAVEPVYASGETALIESLIERVERLEGELNRVQKSSQEPQMMAMLEGFRSEIEEFREKHSTELPVEEFSEKGGDSSPISMDFMMELQTADPLIHEQVFSFEGPVVPEAIVVIQGTVAGHPVFVEVMDRHGNWVEIFTQSEPEGEPTSEFWIECPGAPLTEQVRVMVEGGSGVETMAAENAGSLYWTNSSD